MLDWISLLIAFTVGILASFNPCGFAILPGFVAYYIGSSEDPNTSSQKRLMRGLFLSLVFTFSLVLLFTSIGLAFATLGQRIAKVLPWNQLIVGFLLITLAIFLLLTKRSFGIEKAHRLIGLLKVSPQRSFLFGLAYGIGSLGCTLAPFLTVSANALVSKNLTFGLVQFATFGLGMGAVIIAVALGITLFKGYLFKKIQSISPHVHTLSAYLMLGAGVYLMIQGLRSFIFL